MAKAETFTLITICRNASATIGRTIDSVLAQSMPPVEYIFVDGNSTDGTVEVIESRRQQLEQRGIACHVLAQHCPAGAAGIPDAWNLGLVQAVGDVVGLLNADDWYESDTVASVMGAFAKGGENCDAVVCPVAFRRQDGTVRHLFGIHPFDQLAWRMVVPHPGCFFRKSLYGQLGLYSTAYRISADYDFIWRCHRTNVQWQRIDRPLVNMQDGGAADTSRALARRETRIVARKYVPWWDARPWVAWILRCVAGK